MNLAFPPNPKSEIQLLHKEGAGVAEETRSIGVARNEITD